MQPADGTCVRSDFRCWDVRPKCALSNAIFAPQNDDAQVQVTCALRFRPCCATARITWLALRAPCACGMHARMVCGDARRTHEAHVVCGMRATWSCREGLRRRGGRRRRQSTAHALATSEGYPSSPSSPSSLLYLMCVLQLQGSVIVAMATMAPAPAVLGARCRIRMRPPPLPLRSGGARVRDMCTRPCSASEVHWHGRREIGTLLRTASLQLGVWSPHAWPSGARGVGTALCVWLVRRRGKAGKKRPAVRLPPAQPFRHPHPGRSQPEQLGGGAPAVCGAIARRRATSSSCA
jgi:hypothetical protein